MGLTFQQQFYRVPESVFLVHEHKKNNISIIEVPENIEDAKILYEKLSEFGSVLLLYFDNAIINGYNLMKKVNDNNKKLFDTD